MPRKNIKPTIPGLFASQFPLGEGTPIYKGGATFWVDTKAVGDALQFIPTRTSLGTDATNVRVKNADRHADDIYVRAATLPIPHSVVTYWENYKANKLRPQNRVIIKTGPRRYVDLGILLDDRFNEAIDAARVSLALLEEVCHYAMDVLKSVDFKRSKYRYTADIADATNTLIKWIHTVEQSCLDAYLSSYAGSTAMYLANRRTHDKEQDPVVEAVSTALASEEAEQTVAAAVELYQPELPGMPEIEDCPPQTVSVVETDTITEDLVRSATGCELKDVYITEPPQTVVVAPDVRDVRLSVAMSADNVSMVTFWTLLSDFADLIVGTTTSPCGAATLTLECTVSSMRSVLECIRTNKQ